MTASKRKIITTATATQSTKAAKPAAKVPPIMGEYNGKPTITLRRSEDDKYPFTFGQAKARLILEHLDSIRQFAAQ